MSSRGASTFFLTSAPFACGMAWLANALMKMGIRGTSLVYPNENWQSSEGGRWKFSEKSRDHMVSHLPFAAYAESFSFRSDIEFFWEHRLNFDQDPKAPVIVVTRDPRDAIFSLFRRWQKNGWIAGSYTEFLQRPSEWPDHFPGLFQTTPIKTFLLFNLIWKFASHHRPVLFVRFEDLKTNPEAELQKVFKFLKLADPTADELREAIESSSVGSATPSQNSMIFKGEVFEWKKAGTREDLSFFDDLRIAAAVASLGYESKAEPLSQKRFGLNIRPAFLSFILRRKSQLESLGLDLSRWTSDFERLKIAQRWSLPWEMGQKISVRNFLFHLLPLILTDNEIQHVSNRYNELEAETFNFNSLRVNEESLS